MDIDRSQILQEFYYLLENSCFGIQDRMWELED
jgi:hypothetical protein